MVNDHFFFGQSSYHIPAPISMFWFFFVGGGGLEVRVNCDWSGWTILWCESYCGLWGEWTILWGLVTVGLVRRWNAINYQTMPPTTLHRLTNWNQRNNSTIEAIRKDDDDRSFTGNEMGQYWGKGGFDSFWFYSIVLVLVVGLFPQYLFYHLWQLAIL